MLRADMAPIVATIIIVAGIALFTWTISYRIRPLLFARKDVRWDDPAARTEKLLEYGFGQKRMPAKPERHAVLVGESKRRVAGDRACLRAARRKAQPQ